MCGYHFEVFEAHPDRWDPKIDPDGLEFNDGAEPTLEKARERVLRLCRERPGRKFVLEDWDCGGPCGIREAYRDGFKEPDWPTVRTVSLGPATRMARVSSKRYTEIMEVVRMAADQDPKAEKEAQRLLANIQAEKFDQVVLSTKEHRELLAENRKMKDQLSGVAKFVDIILQDDNLSVFEEELKTEAAKWQKIFSQLSPE